jgi:hypothetical protein
MNFSLGLLNPASAYGGEIPHYDNSHTGGQVDHGPQVLAEKDCQQG